MNRLIILFALFYLLTGCEPTHDTSSEFWKSLVNETDNVLFYVIHTSKGSDSTFSYGHDSIGFYFATYGTITLPPIGPYHIDLDRIFPLEEKLYNLTDTCSFSYLGSLGNWKDSLYRENIFCNDDGGFYKNKSMETLVVRDTLFSIMQKDYSMLEKFREYY
jgi:hypothetical protein